jgi:hypothetical protein
MFLLLRFGLTLLLFQNRVKVGVILKQKQAGLQAGITVYGLILASR